MFHRISRRLQQWLALSAPHKLWLARLWFALLMTWARLKVGRRYRLLQRIAGAASDEPDGGGSALPAEVQAVVRLIDSAARHHVVRVTCLHRSLVCLRVLERFGCAGRLRIGVQKRGAWLSAHAWVECGGYVVNDASDVHQRFHVLSPAGWPEAGGIQSLLPRFD